MSIPGVCVLKVRSSEAEIFMHFIIREESTKNKVAFIGSYKTQQSSPTTIVKVSSRHCRTNDFGLKVSHQISPQLGSHTIQSPETSLYPE